MENVVNVFIFELFPYLGVVTKVRLIKSNSLINKDIIPQLQKETLLINYLISFQVFVRQKRDYERRFGSNIE